MNASDLLKALALCRPGVPVSVNTVADPTLADVVWHGEDGSPIELQDPVTQEELDAALARVDAQVESEVNAANVAGSASRARTDKIEDLERQMASGEITQAEVNSRLIALLKEQVK